jgi:hypothetical protein
MPGLKLYKLRFRGMLHVGQLARFGTVCCDECSVPQSCGLALIHCGQRPPPFFGFLRTPFSP